MKNGGYEYEIFNNFLAGSEYFQFSEIEVFTKQN